MRRVVVVAGCWVDRREQVVPIRPGAADWRPARLGRVGAAASRVRQPWLMFAGGSGVGVRDAGSRPATPRRRRPVWTADVPTSPAPSPVRASLVRAVVVDLAARSADAVGPGGQVGAPQWVRGRAWRGCRAARGVVRGLPSRCVGGRPSRQRGVAAGHVRCDWVGGDADERGDRVCGCRRRRSAAGPAAPARWAPG